MDLSLRWQWVREVMAERGLEAIVCRLNHNVLMLSGYWPINGLSLCVLPLEGEPALIIPDQDIRFAPTSPDLDVLTFQWGDIGHLDPLTGALVRLREVAEARGLRGKRIGMEIDYPIAALPAWTAEIRQWTQPAIIEMQAAFETEFHDAFQMLARSAGRKTPAEIERIRIANKLGGLALETFRNNVQAGRKECEIAAAVEQAIMANGPGTDGVRFARAWAAVMSGSNTQYTGQTYNITTDRVVNEGDVVTLELGLVADGYWTDLTRVHVAGTPNAKQAELYNLVTRAHETQVAAAKLGGLWSDVDKAGRDLLAHAGYVDCFPHITGHSLGFSYHETYPLVAPPVDHRIEVGQIVTIEPGIYTKEWGGFRLEDNYLVTENGLENLSKFGRGLACSPP